MPPLSTLSAGACASGISALMALITSITRSWEREIKPNSFSRSQIKPSICSSCGSVRVDTTSIRLIANRNVKGACHPEPQHLSSHGNHFHSSAFKVISNTSEPVHVHERKFLQLQRLVHRTSPGISAGSSTRHTGLSKPRANALMLSQKAEGHAKEVRCSLLPMPITSSLMSTMFEPSVLLDWRTSSWERSHRLISKSTHGNCIKLHSTGKCSSTISRLDGARS